MSDKVTIAHLYPREMNIYGDMGNVITLVKRLEWRGYRVKVLDVEIGELIDWSTVDLVFGGGGQDSGQTLVSSDLIKHGAKLREMAANGIPMLVICGLYQLFGKGFLTVSGDKIPGIGIFNASTYAGNTRMIGNMVVESKIGLLVGFENHSGQTVLNAGQAPLGITSKGQGNTTNSQQEGAITNEVIGTYLHGPVLPKNPSLADHLLLAALQLRYGVLELQPLQDTLEQDAAKVAASRPK